jgi:hypothetical protein
MLNYKGRREKMRKKLKTDLLRASCTIPAGATVEVTCMPDGVGVAAGTGKIATVGYCNAYMYFAGFSKPPGIGTMMRWSRLGIARTPTGKKVEPDGVGPDGAPSWMLILGIL